LHAQLLMPAHPASILMLSPILGAFENGSTGQAFVPPMQIDPLQALNTICFDRFLPRIEKVRADTLAACDSHYLDHPLPNPVGGFGFRVLSSSDR
jgi:hypothetical protein